MEYVGRPQRRFEAMPAEILRAITDEETELLDEELLGLIALAKIRSLAVRNLHAPAWSPHSAGAFLYCLWTTVGCQWKTADSRTFPTQRRLGLQFAHIEFLRHIDRNFVQRVTCYKVAHTEAVRIGVVARFSTSGRGRHTGDTGGDAHMRVVQQVDVICAGSRTRSRVQKWVIFRIAFLTSRGGEPTNAFGKNE